MSNKIRMTEFDCMNEMPVWMEPVLFNKETHAHTTITKYQHIPLGIFSGMETRM